MANGRISIVADPAGAGFDFAKRIYQEVSKFNGQFDLNPLEVKIFPDGELKPKIKLNVRGETCYFIHDSNKEPCRWFAELALVNQALRKSAAAQIIDVFPYIRFSRQDRKDEPRVPISTQVVAGVINPWADGVVTLDAHSPAALDNALDVRYDNLHSFETAAPYIRNTFGKELNNLVVMSPDHGGFGRAQKFAQHVGIETVVGCYKTRGKDGGVKQMKIAGAEEVQNRGVILIDDMVDSGGTAVKAAELARQAGAKAVYAYFTHGLFTKGVDAVAQQFDKIYVGDTLKQNPHDKLEVISFAPLFAKAIHRMSLGMSLSELFETS